MKNKILCLPGDGIGPEITNAAIQVMKTINEDYGLDIEILEGYIGGAAYDKYSHPFPDETIEQLSEVDGVLLGAVGDYKYDSLSSDLRPEKGLLSLRENLDAYCNLRPIKSFSALSDMMPTVHKDIDICFVRELVGGIYFGDKTLSEDYGSDLMNYSTREVKRITEAADEVAKNRSGKVTSVDKSNVLSSSKIWRKTVNEVSVSSVNHMYVDNAAMQLILNPNQFDVILTSNMFGDILSDEASALVGSIGILPSASFGTINVYEPIHGSAPDIKGEDIANPIGMILSVAMMFEHTYNRKDLSDLIYEGVENVINDGYGTLDLKLNKHVTTTEWTNHLIDQIRKKD